MKIMNELKEQNGLAVIPIIVIIVVVIGVGLLSVRMFNHNKPEPAENTASPSVTSQTPIASASLVPSPSVIASKKPAVSPSPKPSPSVSPSSANSSPTPTPSPKEGVYKLEPSPEQVIKIAANAPSGSGYVMAALLKDSNGEVVADQKDFHFEWSIEDAGLFNSTVDPGGGYGCTGSSKIKSPCPNNNMAISSKGTKGHTVVHVKAQKSGQTVAETQFNVEVY